MNTQPEEQGGKTPSVQPTGQDSGPTAKPSVNVTGGSVVALSQAPLRPNMLLINADATSSTFSKVRSDHSVFSDDSYFNCLFHSANFEGSSFNACQVDGSLFENCSFRGVALVNCDVDELVINGIKVGALLKMLVQGE